MTWHVDNALLDRYTAEALSDAGMASVELHVTTCATCRGLVAARTDGATRARVKQALDVRLDTPRAGFLERALERVGLNDSDSRIVGATLALHGSWLAACVLTLAFVAMAASAGPGRVGAAVFLVAAPLVPLAGVALAYGPRADPTFEIALAASMPGGRVALLRTLAVTAPAIPGLVVLSLFLPFGPLAFAWLLPAVGLAAATLALGTLLPPTQVATGLAAVWLLGAGVTLAGAPRSSAEVFVRGFAAFRPSGQLLFIVLGVASLLLVGLRRAEFETAR